MKFLARVKQFARKIGKRLEKSVAKVMSRGNSRPQGQGRPHAGPSRGGRRPGGGHDRQMEDLSRRMESLSGFSTTEEGGATVHILTNHFQVRCRDEPTEKVGEIGAEGGVKMGIIQPKEFTVHQFRIEFAEKDMPVPFKKSILNACKTSVFGGAYLYDGGNQLYCTNLFNKNDTCIEPQLERLGPDNKPVMEKVQLTFMYVKTLVPTDPMCLQIYNLIIRQCMFGIGLDPLGDNFYDSKAVVSYPNLKIQLWPGYICSVKPCEKGLLLCVDVVHKVIHNEDLLSMIKELKNTHERRRIAKTLNEYISDALKGYMVITPYNKKGYKVDGIRTDLTPLSKFQLKDGESITFCEYYKRRYNFDIMDKGQPLIYSMVKQKFQGKKSVTEVLLVPELCFLTGLSEEMRSNMSVMRELAKHLHMSPADRVMMIQNFMQRMLKSEKVNETLENWGILFDSKLIPCIPAKVLARESIIFARDRRFRADEKNDWTRALREHKMLVSVPLKKWIVVTGERDEKTTSEFVETMIRVALPLGFQIDAPIAIETLKDNRTANYIRNLETWTAGRYNDVQLVLCVLPNNGAELYNGIKKRLTKDIGIVSQCIIAKTMSKNMMSVATKVVVQINTKLGGEPWKITIPPEFHQNSMTIGFECTGKGTRTGVLVGTVNKDYTRYHSLTFQYKEQSELNEKLVENINAIVRAYARENGNKPPSCVVFYRNNVDEGRVDSGEIEVDADKLLTGLEECWKGKTSERINLVYIILAKGSSTRLMSHVGECGEGEEDTEASIDPSQVVNPPPGTIVDRDVVTCNRKYKEFFIVPTVARQGTVRAIQYRVILDTKNFPPAILEAFSYKMCHLYYNWTGVVNLPSVIQYASKFAKQATQTLPNAQPHANLASCLHFL